jgi:hypothetical protein
MKPSYFFNKRHIEPWQKSFMQILVGVLKIEIK